MAAMGTMSTIGLGDDLLSQESNILDPMFQHEPLQPQVSQPLQPSPPPPTTSNSPLFSCFPVQPQSQSPSSTTSSSKRKASSDQDEQEQVALKRQRNTIAARKYRQKRLDRIAELEKALEDMTGDRDDLRLKLARREAEVDALREMLGRK